MVLFVLKCWYNWTVFAVFYTANVYLGSVNLLYTSATWATTCLKDRITAVSHPSQANTPTATLDLSVCTSELPKYFHSHIKKSFKTAICCDSRRETLQRLGETCWKMATLPVMNLPSVGALLEAQWKEDAREKSLPEMSVRQPISCWSAIGWREAKQRAASELWGWSRLYLFTFKWIFSMTGLQTRWYLISRCVKQKNVIQIQTASKSSQQARRCQHQGRICLVLLTSTWSLWVIS